jgi:L-lactate permease
MILILTVVPSVGHLGPFLCGSQLKSNFMVKCLFIETAQTSAAEPPFTPDKVHHSQDLDPPRRGC